MDSHKVVKSLPTTKKIVITGPESTGKSTLAQQLSEFYKADWVPEYAREFIDALGRPYIESDLWNIAVGQLALEDLFLKNEPKLLFLDSDLITIYIWSKFKYGRVDKRITENIINRKYDSYLLCGIDLPWQPDPQREHPNQRDVLYEMYKSTLQEFEKPFIEIRGSNEQRFTSALKAVSIIEK